MRSASAYLQLAARAVKRHAPAILTGLGVASMVGGTVLAVRATPEASRRVESVREETGEEPTPKEAVRAAWKCYVPAVAMSGAGVALIVAANVVSSRRSAALVTAATISERALGEYRGKVGELFGEEGAGKVADSIAQDRLNANPVREGEVVRTGEGDDLFYDVYSGRYFRSSRAKVEAAVNLANETLLRNGYFSLNDMYELEGLEPTRIGDEVGWHVSGGLIELSLSTMFASDGSPCGVVDFARPPVYCYED